jgi:hypothetical protein
LVGEVVTEYLSVRQGVRRGGGSPEFEGDGAAVAVDVRQSKEGMDRAVL